MSTSSRRATVKVCAFLPHGMVGEKSYFMASICISLTMNEVQPLPFLFGHGFTFHATSC
jgi:hypothetical protein